MTSLSWFNPLVHAYSPAQWRPALEHVLFVAKDHRAVLAALRSLQSKVPDVGTLNEVVSLLERSV